MEQLSLFEEIYNVAKPEDEMLEIVMLRGSGFASGKKRIYDFILTNPSSDKLANFLKDEYGIGGFSSPTRSPNYVHGEHHDSKGISFRMTDRDGNEVEDEITWNKAAEVIIGMVKRGIYQKEETN